MGRYDPGSCEWSHRYDNSNPPPPLCPSDMNCSYFYERRLQGIFHHLKKSDRRQGCKTHMLPVRRVSTPGLPRAEAEINANLVEGGRFDDDMASVLKQYYLDIVLSRLAQHRRACPCSNLLFLLWPFDLHAHGAAVCNLTGHQRSRDTPVLLTTARGKAALQMGRGGLSFPLVRFCQRIPSPVHPAEKLLQMSKAPYLSTSPSTLTHR